MRTLILACCLSVPAAGYAQTTSTDPGAARLLPNTDLIVATSRSTEQSRTGTLASGVGKNKAPVSKNEAYNLGRAASGRVGVRVGNDMSFLVGK